MNIEHITNKIKTRDFIIGILGLGYIGLPLARTFSEAKFKVYGFDTNDKKIETLKNGQSPLDHIGDQTIKEMLAGGFVPKSNFGDLSYCDAIIICVPTLTKRNKLDCLLYSDNAEGNDLDLSYLWKAVETIGQKLIYKNKLIVLESTSYIGTTQDILTRLTDGTGFKCPEDFCLAFSPEREDPGNKIHTTKMIPKIVGGVNQESTDVISYLYSSAFDKVVPVSSDKVAEATKLYENIFRLINIAYAIQMKNCLSDMGVNIYEVIAAAKTKEFGFMPFTPGLGVGGSCIPINPLYFMKTCRAEDSYDKTTTSIIDTALEIAEEAPFKFSTKLYRILKKEGIIPEKILLLGLSYKPNIGDDRESVTYDIMREMSPSHEAKLSPFNTSPEMLLQRPELKEYHETKVVDYCDPYIYCMQQCKYGPKKYSVACHPKIFAEYDVVVLVTPHSQFYNKKLYEGVKVLVDPCNIIKEVGTNTKLIRL